MEETNLPVRTSVTELARLGKKKEIRELSRRLADLSPGGVKLNDEEALALAQYSWSLGANPLVGETWLLKNHSTGQVLGLMPGISLHRRRADEKDERNEDVRWVEYTNVSDPDERATFAIPQNAMAIKARIYRQSTNKAYSDAVEKLADAGAPWDEIKQVLGNKPYIEGIGILTKQDMDAMNRGRNKMPHKQRCEKRAEAHALKQAYHLPFGYVALSDEGMSISSGATLDEYIVEGDFRDAPPGEEPLFPEETPPEQPHWRSEQPTEPQTPTESPPQGTESPPQGTESPPVGVKRQVNQWEDNVVKALVDLNLVQAPPHAINILNLSVFKRVIPYGKLRVTQAIAYALCWEETKKQEPDLSSEDRAKKVDQLYPGWESQAVDMAASLE